MLKRAANTANKQQTLPYLRHKHSEEESTDRRRASALRVRPPTRALDRRRQKDKSRDQTKESRGKAKSLAKAKLQIRH